MSNEEPRMTSYNHDAAVELAQAESIVREWLPFTRDGEAMCWVMAEYDRRGAELEQLRRQRAAVLALADEWDAQHGGTNLSRKLREALGAEA